MNSIRTKIQGTLVGSILLVVFCAGIMLIANQYSADKNKKIIETMTMEYSINSMTDELISTYNNAVKSPGDVETMLAYQTNRDKIFNVLSSLKKRIVSEESLASLVGVENTVNKVIFECDTGLEEIQQEDFLNISDHFVAANTNNTFVQDNVRNLLEKELEYLSSIQESSKLIYMYSLIASVVIFLVVIVFVLVFASSFSKQLISPIELLSKTAERVASGEMDTPIEKKLLEQKDEVGVLASSFVYMVNAIKTKMTELSASNKNLESSKEALEEGNMELKKLNSFMVDREVKMMELKKRVSELEK